MADTVRAQSEAWGRGSELPSLLLARASCALIKTQLAAISSRRAEGVGQAPPEQVPGRAPAGRSRALGTWTRARLLCPRGLVGSVAACTEGRHRAHACWAGAPRCPGLGCLGGAAAGCGACRETTTTIHCLLMPVVQSPVFSVLAARAGRLWARRMATWPPCRRTPSIMMSWQPRTGAGQGATTPFEPAPPGDSEAPAVLAVPHVQYRACTGAWRLRHHIRACKRSRFARPGR